MERDPHISKMIREGGIERAPMGFTQRVMDQIASLPEKKSYKPLIGKGGQIFITLLGITFVLLAVIFADPGSKLVQPEGLLQNIEWKIPEFHLNMQFFSRFSITGGVAAALVALFILVLSDAGFRNKRLI
jgi:hypothetical protein